LQHPCCGVKIGQKMFLVALGLFYRGGVIEISIFDDSQGCFSDILVAYFIPQKPAQMGDD
jgi:hypothetical protein